MRLSDTAPWRSVIAYRPMEPLLPPPAVSAAPLSLTLLWFSFRVYFNERMAMYLCFNIDQRFPNSGTRPPLPGGF
jgi:hypothetical protein